MTRIASLSDLEPIITGLQNQLFQLQTTVNALGAPPSMQNGVLAASDGLLSSASVDGTTGAVTLTFPTATDPIYVLNTQGVLTPTVFMGQTITLSPPTLPASAHTLCVGVELSPGGTLSLVCGASASGNLAIGSLTSPASTAGLLRLADIALTNVSGTYESGFVQGTNWRDRRPWANGIARRVKRTAGNINLGLTAATPFDSSSFTQRIECSGVPLTIVVSGMVNTGTALTDINFAWGCLMDGTNVDGNNDGLIATQIHSPSGSSAQSFVYYNEFTPAAGSHLFAPTGWASSTSGTPFVYSNAGIPLIMRLREDIAVDAGNGTA